MSTISDAYDYLVTKVSGVLTDHTRIRNAYELEDNSDKVVDKGWGINVQPGYNPQLTVSCEGSYIRTFEIVITRRVNAKTQDGAAVGTVEKLLLEDHYTVFKELEKGDGIRAAGIAKLTVLSDNGREPVFPDKNNYIADRLLVEITYFEDLNA